MLGDPKTHKDEKTEPPSRKKWRKQESEGNVFMSQEMEMTIVVFCAAWILKYLGPWIFRHFYIIMVKSFSDG